MNFLIPMARRPATCICGSVTISVRYFFSHWRMSLASASYPSSMNGGAPERNQIDALLRELGGKTLVLRDRSAKFRNASGLEIEQQWNDADPLGQNSYQFLQGAGTPRRSDHSDYAAPECEAHLPSHADPWRSLIDRNAGRRDHLGPFFRIGLQGGAHVSWRAGDDLHPLRSERSDEPWVRCCSLHFE